MDYIYTLFVCHRHVQNPQRDTHSRVFLHSARSILLADEKSSSENSRAPYTSELIILYTYIIFYYDILNSIRRKRHEDNEIIRASRICIRSSPAIITRYIILYTRIYHGIHDAGKRILVCSRFLTSRTVTERHIIPRYNNIL